MASGDSQPGPENDYCRSHATLLADSFRRLTGGDLGPADLEGAALAKYLYDADFVLVSHATEADPIFNYANRKAQNLFELDWPQFVALPSRQSAEPVNQQERDRLMARVTRDGFIDDYAGVRISSSGRRFRIESATVWNLLGPCGKFCGQAATFDRWVYLE